MDIEHKNELGKLLLRKKVVEPQFEIEHFKLLTVMGGNSRNLANILVEDYKFDHHTIYKELADLYAFRTLEFDEENDSENVIETIKRSMGKI